MFLSFAELRFSLNDTALRNIQVHVQLYQVKVLPEIFETYLLPIKQAHNYNTRSKSNQNYFLNFVSTTIGKNSTILRRSNHYLNIVRGTREEI